jgi:hypothetical protein
MLAGLSVLTMLARSLSNMGTNYLGKISQMPEQQISEKDWISFLEKQYADEHLFVQPRDLGTVGFIRAVEQFVLSRLAAKQNP